MATSIKAQDKIKQCEHSWRIFHDNNLDRTGMLSFFCEKCLELRKIEKDYQGENE